MLYNLNRNPTDERIKEYCLDMFKDLAAIKAAGLSETKFKGLTKFGKLGIEAGYAKYKSSQKQSTSNENNN